MEKPRFLPLGLFTRGEKLSVCVFGRGRKGETKILFSRPTEIKRKSNLCFLIPWRERNREGRSHVCFILLTPYAKEEEKKG